MGNRFYNDPQFSRELSENVVHALHELTRKFIADYLAMAKTYSDVFDFTEQSLVLCMSSYDFSKRKDTPDISFIYGDPDSVTASHDQIEVLYKQGLNDAKARKG